MMFKVDSGCFTYPKTSRLVLDHVSFSADTGELVAILGPNGAGKTTLLRCAMGFLKWSSGNSTLDGKTISSLSYKDLWTAMSYVPQARGAVSAYTVEEMVLLGRSSTLSAFSMPSVKDIERAEKALDDLGILSLKDRLCSKLSGGELQMVLIARALASDPKVLILDEPESNLDFRNQLMVLETLTRLKQKGITCIFNTHYPAHAMQRADKALLFNKDGTSLFGSVDTVITEANLKQSFQVDTVISEIETPVSIIRDVVPVTLSGSSQNSSVKKENFRRLATVSIICENQESGIRINEILHAYSSSLIGRMGMPYPEGGVSIINVNIDAPENTVQEMTRKLAILEGVSVKATFAKSYIKEDADHE